MKSKKVLILAAAVCGFLSCKKDSSSDNTKKDFDRKALLTNIGNNIIVPGYQVLQVKANALDSIVTVFNKAADATTLVSLQSAFKEFYQAWQTCSPYELGTAEKMNFNLNSNTFPTDLTKINNNISAGTYNLSVADNIPAKGLPAVDYLLFGSDNTTVLSWYTTDSKALNRKQYLAAIVSELKTNVTTVLAAWTTSGGNYISTFISADGTDIGSSVGQLINKLDYDYDVMKNNKLAIPLGKQSMGTLFPEKVEAYYSGISSQLLLLQLKSMQNIYLGNSAQGEGTGFDDYLSQIAAKYNGGSLSDTIKNQFAVAITKLQAVPDPLSATISSNPAPVNAAYLEVQKLLVLLKTDMPSALGVLITYADNDGD